MKLGITFEKRTSHTITVGLVFRAALNGFAFVKETDTLLLLIASSLNRNILLAEVHQLENS